MIITMGMLTITSAIEIDTSCHERYEDGSTKNCTLHFLNISVGMEIRVQYIQPPEILTCRYCTLYSIPYKLFEYLPILNSVHFSNCLINAIAVNDFQSANHLTHIDLSWNNIEKLPSSVFLLAPKLESINLAHNRISEIGDNIVSRLNQLKTLILSDNELVKFDFDSMNSHLKKIHLHNNDIHQIGVIFYYDLVELTVNNNSLTNGSFLISSANAIEILDISSNPFEYLPNLRVEILKQTHINATSVYISHNAQIIDASFNQIAEIIVDNKYTTHDLIELNLSHNNLTSISNLTSLSYLTELDLSFNRINDIKIDTFSNMSQLKILKLEQCGLKKISYGLFAHQQNLINLDISYNNLNSVDLNILSGLNELQTLYIDGNGLQTINGIKDVRQLFPKLMSIGLSDNNLECVELTDTVKTLNRFLIKLIVNENIIVKNASNVKGVRCLSGKDSDPIPQWHIAVNHIDPIALSSIGNLTAEIERKFNEIHGKINSLALANDSDKLPHNHFVRQYNDDQLSVKQQIMDLKMEVELKLNEFKTDILMAVTTFNSNNNANKNASENNVNNNIDVKLVLDEMNGINLERYQLLSQKIKRIADDMESVRANMGVTLVRSTSKLSNVNGETISNGDADIHDLSSIKWMVTSIFIVIFCCALLCAGIVVWNRDKFSYVGRRLRQSRYSNTTVNTAVEEQSSI